MLNLKGTRGQLRVAGTQLPSSPSEVLAEESSGRRLGHFGGLARLSQLQREAQVQLCCSDGTRADEP